jgi:integral membrane sensor domain MASE1
MGNQSNQVIKMMAINLAVAIVYATCCYLAHKYMVRPTLSVTIWPAAGIGVGCILVWGKRIIPAIALAELINGFLLYEIHKDFGWNRVTLFDSLLYINSVIRPTLAGFLALYFVGNTHRLIELGRIIRFFYFCSRDSFFNNHCYICDAALWRWSLYAR